MLSITLWAMAQVLSFIATADTAKTTDPWAETGLTAQSLEDRLTSEACNHSAYDLMGCVKAVNILLRAQNPSLSLSPASKDPSYKVVRRFKGNIDVVHTEPVAPARTWSEGKKIQAAFESLWRPVFQKKTKVPFESIVKWLFKRAYPSPALTAKAINHLVSYSLGGHAFIFPADQNPGRLSPVFYGLGFCLEEVAEGVMKEQPHPGRFYHRVKRVTPGFPAYKSGFAVGDIILRIDGEDAAFANANESNDVFSLLTNEASIIAVDIQRGTRQETIQFDRKFIPEPNVVGYVLNDFDENYGYIVINSINKHTDEITEQTLQQLKRHRLKGLILDLRFNSGGILETAVKTAGLFLGSTKIAQTQDLKNPNNVEHRNYKGPLITDLPLVVLTGPSTASGAELIAGTLQDHNRAYLLGTRTFGKGSVVIAEPFDTLPGVGILRPAALYTSFKGGTIQGVGVSPDFEVQHLPYPSSSEAKPLYENDRMTRPHEVEQSSEKPDFYRQQTLDRIRVCLDSKNDSYNHFDKKNGTLFPDSLSDFQMLRAQELLECTFETGAE